MVVVTHRIFDTITGNPVMTRLNSHASSWRDSLTTVGTGRCTVSYAGTPYSRAQWTDATRHWARTVVELHDGHPVFAGLIRDIEKDHEPQLMTFDLVAVAAVMRARFPFGVGSYETDPDFVVTSASLRSAVERAINRMIGRDSPTWGDTWALPFDFQHIAESGSFSHTWKKTDFTLIDSIVSTIRKMTGGPDVAFRPKLVDNRLRWDVVTGNPRIPGPTIDLPMSVRASRARGLRTHDQGANMASGVFAPGDGSGPDRKVGRAGYFTGAPADAPPMIVRDVATNDGRDLDNVALLDSLAGQYLASTTWSTKQREFTLNAEPRDDAFHPGLVKLGARFDARWSGDPTEPPFHEQLYTIALAFDSSRPSEYRPEVTPL